VSYVDGAVSFLGDGPKRRRAKAIAKRALAARVNQSTTVFGLSCPHERYYKAK
jgi:hypothetical protein